MTLQDYALARAPMPTESVQRLFDCALAARLPPNSGVLLLCASHERLRMELAGAEEMLRQAGFWRDKKYAGEPNPFRGS